MVYFKRFESWAEAVAHIMDYISFYNNQTEAFEFGVSIPSGL